MLPCTLLTFLASILTFQPIVTVAATRRATLHEKREIVPFYPPAAGGGSNLDDAGSGGGEPLNVIISGLSSPSVLTNDGFLNYARSLGFSQECFNIHLGNPQSANLGDGHGAVNQTMLLREDFNDPDVGTCFESLFGGNHFRVFRQNGPLANSSALFLAVSKEEPISKQHTIVPNGYNIGRDLLVKAATINGTTAFKGVKYSTTSQDIPGLLPIGTHGINHNISIDGIVKLLNVTIVSPASSVHAVGPRLRLGFFATSISLVLAVYPFI